MDLQELNAVLEREPTLAYTGFVYRGNRQPGNDTPQALREGREQFAKHPELDLLTKVEDLLKTVGHTQRICSGYSYYLKHVVERLVGEYVSNGQLILVALHLGFKHRVQGPNCIFNMNAKDIDKLGGRPEARLYWSNRKYEETRPQATSHSAVPPVPRLLGRIHAGREGQQKARPGGQRA